jgi:hypothetical protein
MKYGMHLIYFTVFICLKNCLVLCVILNAVSINIDIFRNWLTCLMVCYFLLPVALRPNVGHGFLILEVSRSHTMTPLDEWSQRPLPYNTQHSQQTSMPPAGFKSTISESKLLQMYALDRAATRNGVSLYTWLYQQSTRIKPYLANVDNKVSS